MRQPAGCWGGHGRRDLLYISHLNCAPFPSGQDLLDALPKKTVAFGDSLAAPSKKKIELDRFSLNIRAVVLNECGYLGRKADAVLANLAPQLVQAKLLDVLLRLTNGIKPPGALGKRPRLQRRLTGKRRNRDSTIRHAKAIVAGKL